MVEVKKETATPFSLCGNFDDFDEEAVEKNRRAAALYMAGIDPNKYCLQPGGDTATVTTCNDDSSSLHLSLPVRDRHYQFVGVSQLTSAFFSGSNGIETTTPVALQGDRTAGSSQNHTSSHSSGSSLDEDKEDGLASMPLIPPGAPSPDAGGGSVFLCRLFTTGGMDRKGAGAGAW